MLYSELASYTAATIRADFAAASITPSAEMQAYLAALDNRIEGCWKKIFTTLTAWMAVATPEEVRLSWLAVVKVCGVDARPLAAYSRLYAFKDNVEVLKNLWQWLPPDALPSLKVAVAANPLLLALFQDPGSGVTGLPSELVDPVRAAEVWAKVTGQMEKLRQRGGLKS